LEAGIAMHGINNVLTFGILVFSGEWSHAFIRPETTGNPLMLLLVAVNGIAFALIMWQAKRVGIQPYYQPPIQPYSPVGLPPAPAYPLTQYPR
jgi:hypothetical protein